MRNFLSAESSDCSCILGLLRRDAGAAPGGLDQLRFGERICEVYETFLGLFERPQISFDHARHLLRLLESENEICLDDCGGCGSLLIVTPYAERPKACEFCASKRPTMKHVAPASVQAPRRLLISQSGGSDGAAEPAGCRVQA